MNTLTTRGSTNTGFTQSEFRIEGFLIHASLYTAVPVLISLLITWFLYSIFIVHGLNGGTHRSFNHPTTNNVWFRDFLPDHVFDEVNRTNGRIWAYGYNAAYAFQNAGNTGPYDLAIELLHSVLHARKKGRKIIFVCHSLGGIIVKNVCIPNVFFGQIRRLISYRHWFKQPSIKHTQILHNLQLG